MDSSKHKLLNQNKAGGLTRQAGWQGRQADKAGRLTKFYFLSLKSHKKYFFKYLKIIKYKTFPGVVLKKINMKRQQQQHQQKQQQQQQQQQQAPMAQWPGQGQTLLNVFGL